MSTPQEILAALTAALQQLQFLERSRTNYHLVVVPDDNHVRVEHFTGIPELVEALRVYVQQPSPPQVIPFIGAPMPITRPPNRQLRTPDGLIPLEVQDQFLDEDDLTWSLGEAAPEVLDDTPQMPNVGNIDIDEDDEEIDDDDLGDDFDDNEDDAAP